VDGKNLWSLLDTMKHHIPIPFNLMELMALYFSRDMMKVFKDTVFYDNLEPLTYLDRIKMLHQTKETFEVPQDFDLEEFLGASFGVYQGEPMTGKIRFSPEVAGYIKEKIWHDSQKLEPQEDGSLLFEAVVAGTQEIKYWILGWGSHAEVLEPEDLRKAICAEAMATLNLYQNTATLAAIFISLPVCGFLSFWAALLVTLKVPKPIRVTLSPFFKAFVF
jgi:hypothetical protein